MSYGPILYWCSKAPQCNANPLFNRQWPTHGCILSAKFRGHSLAKVNKSRMAHAEILNPVLSCEWLQDNFIPPINGLTNIKEFFDHTSNHCGLTTANANTVVHVP